MPKWAVHKGGESLKPGERKRNGKQAKEERIGFYNAERYADPTAYAALPEHLSNREAGYGT